MSVFFKGKLIVVLCTKWIGRHKMVLNEYTAENRSKITEKQHDIKINKSQFQKHY